MKKNILGKHVFNGISLIGLISDTHIPEAKDSLWPEVYSIFKDVDLILHAGDMHNISVLKELETIATTIACRGNGDDGSSGRPLLADDRYISENQIIFINSRSIGLTHSFLHDPKLGISAHQQMMEKFNQVVDIVVAGDTHVPIIKNIFNSSVVINSGSPILPYNFNTQLGTVGFIQLFNSQPADMWIEALYE